MSRSRLWGAAAALGLLGAGCAHCDTCDDVPVPCTGPNCNAALRVAPMAGPASVTPGPGPFAPGPSMGLNAATGSPANESTPRLAVPPPPDVPADAPSPPAGPAAPEKP